MKPSFTRGATAVLLFFTAMGSYAASVESELSDTDTVIIGAASEKVTLRVTGFKNLTSDSANLGTFSASTTSGLGQIAVTLAPEHRPTPWSNSANYQYLSGKIKNEKNEEAEITVSVGHEDILREVNGVYWLLGNQRVDGHFEQIKGLSQGVYPITMRAALYQN